MAKAIRLEEVVAQARQLSTLDKVRLIERVTPEIERELAATEADRPATRRSLWGLWADLGPAPSAEEIDQARREAWRSFPRDDF